MPEGISLKKPCEYDTKTLMKILEQSHRIQFTVKRWVCLLLGWRGGSRQDITHLCMFYQTTALTTEGQHVRGGAMNGPRSLL